MAAKRTYDDPIFGRLRPDETALQYIHEREREGKYKLVATTPADDMTALELEARLKGEHGNVIHYMHSAWRDRQAVGINLYFVEAQHAQVPISA